MGDGRYYTFEQFYNIIILLSLAVFIIISAMSSYYRNTRNKGSKYVTSIFILLEVIVISRFIEEVVVSQEIARFLRAVQNAFFILVCSTFVRYILGYVIPTYQFKRKKVEQKNFSNILLDVMLIIFTFSSLAYESSKGKLIINNYSFDMVYYTKGFITLITISLSILIYITLKIYMFNKIKQPIELSIYKSRIVAIILLLMCVIPLSFYLVTIYKGSSYTDIIEFIIYFMFALAVRILVISFVPYSITPLAFDGIKDMILDYVFIIDDNSTVIYRNNNVENVGFFSAENEFKNIYSLFKNSVKTKRKHGFVCIELKTEDKINYFIYKTKQLNNKKKTKGTIITVTDVTELINMLDYLEDRKRESEEVNRKLIRYSKEVYYLEKEKEINYLMEEIASVQENMMLDIEMKVRQAITQIDEEESFLQSIDEIIQLADKNLFQVRKAVTAYKEYYGGFGYDKGSIG